MPYCIQLDLLIALQWSGHANRVPHGRRPHSATVRTVFVKGVPAQTLRVRQRGGSWRMVATRETHASTSPQCCGLFPLRSNTPCPPDHRAAKTSLSFHPFHGARAARRSPGHDGARQHAPDPSGLRSTGPARRRGQSWAGRQRVRVRRSGRPGDARGAANALCMCFGAGGYRSEAVGSHDCGARGVRRPEPRRNARNLNGARCAPSLVALGSEFVRRLV